MDERPGPALVLAGRRITNAWDRLARYCGLPWSGGPPETWAYRYYDALPSRDRDQIDALDVLASAALHPGLSRPDLAFFREEVHHLEGWLRTVPDVPLHAADPETLQAVASLATWDLPVTLSLLTKVLHRKRPRLIPLIDRDVVDFYRPVTGERSVTSAWPGFLEALRHDLPVPPTHSSTQPHALNMLNLGFIGQALKRWGIVGLSDIRIADIVIWMGAQGMAVDE